MPPEDKKFVQEQQKLYAQAQAAAEALLAKQQALATQKSILEERKRLDEERNRHAIVQNIQLQQPYEHRFALQHEQQLDEVHRELETAQRWQSYIKWSPLPDVKNPQILNTYISIYRNESDELSALLSGVTADPTTAVASFTAASSLPFHIINSINSGTLQPDQLIPIVLNGCSTADQLVGCTRGGGFTSRILTSLSLSARLQLDQLSVSLIESLSEPSAAPSQITQLQNSISTIASMTHSRLDRLTAALLTEADDYEAKQVGYPPALAHLGAKGEEKPSVRSVAPAIPPAHASFD